MIKKLYVPANPAADDGTTSAEIDALFEQLETDGTTEIVIYCHGGLNNRAYAEQTADRLAEEWKANGRLVIGIIWETGVGETFLSILQHKLDRPIIRAGIGTLQSWLNRLKLGSVESNELDNEGMLSPVGVDEFANLPPDPEAMESPADIDTVEAWQRDLEDFVESQLEEDKELSDAFDEVSADSKPTQQDHSSDESLLQPVAVTEAGMIGDAISSALPKPKFVNAGMKVAKRLSSGRGHGALSTIIEELVREYSFDVIKAAWDDMKRRAWDMWRPDTSGQNREKPAAYFLEKLIEWERISEDRTIDAIGHSAGSIVVSHLLAETAWRFEHIQEETPFFRNIIFMAPAATVDLFEDEVVTKTDRFQRFRMFTMSDEYEQKDDISVNGITLYDKSLLYLVAGILEQEADYPLSGMMRYYSGEAPFESHKLLRAGRFLHEDGAGRLIQSVTQGGPVDQQTSAITHGDFDNNRDTMKSIKVMLSSEIE